MIDDEQLEWSYKTVDIPVRTDKQLEFGKALELVCLDDSALFRAVPFSNPGTIESFIDMWGNDGIKDIIKTVKGMYLEIDQRQLSNI